MPLAALSWLNRPRSGIRPIAEAVFATVFFACAIYGVLIEGFQNWQAIWTSGAYILLGIALWLVRSKDASQLSPTPRVPEQEAAEMRDRTPVLA